MTEDEANPDEVDDLTREIHRVCAQFDGPNQFADAMTELMSLREQVESLGLRIDAAKLALDPIIRRPQWRKGRSQHQENLHHVRWALAYLNDDKAAKQKLLQIDLRAVGYD